jgi:serine/threonine protein kinase
MEPERLKRIDFLFNQAISLPPEEREPFLAKECRDNEKDIYDEVLSLLSYQATDKKFLESSPFPVNTRFKPGDFIGQYEIHSFIGHGSTGDVYSARHPRLPGRVAIKVLAIRLVNDAVFLERFKSEAHITDSLAHPHILKVLDIGQQGDVHYIVSEFVDGSSLREYIGKLPLAQAMDYARQIGEALETAHDAGIIHRDIKPENIMVLKGARHIKVLDFGLSKQTRLPPKQDSLPGVAIGTLDYMSPEALRGNGDLQADIWSWSVVVYEMVAGKLPSEAGDARNRPSNNRDLNRWMAKALAPRIEERHRTIQEALRDLPKIVPVPPWRKWQRLAAALVLLLAAVSAYWLWINRPQVIFRVAPLTDSGNITLAAISPDAKYVAYAATASGGQLLYIRQIDSPQERMIVPVNPEAYVGITFSPDGQYIYYVREQKDGSKILYRVSVQGGDSKLILREVDTGISFSPDGKQIAFLRGHQPPPPDTYIKVSVVLATVDGTSVGVPRELPPLASPDVFFLNAPLWSTDGLSVLCVKWDTTKKDAQIMTIRVTDGQILRQVPVPWKWVKKPVWLYMRIHIWLRWRGLMAGFGRGDMNLQYMATWMQPQAPGKLSPFNLKGKQVYGSSHCLLLIHHGKLMLRPRSMISPGPPQALLSPGQELEGHLIFGR